MVNLNSNSSLTASGQSSAGSRLSDLLKRSGLLTEEQINAILARKNEGNVSVTQMVAESGYASEADFLAAIGKALGMPFMRLNEVAIPRNILDKLSAKMVFQYNIIPIAFENGTLQVATSDPLNAGVVDVVRLVSGLRVRMVLSPSADIGKAINKFYGVGADTMERLMEDHIVDDTTQSILTKIDLSEMDQDASIVKFVNQVIWEAYKSRATDIHFEPMEDELRIRYRVDGVLHQTSMPPQLKRFQAAIISRIKVLSQMDIAEKRLPQDGRIGMTIHGESLDIRVSTMPTAYGESVSLRLLTRGAGLLALDGVGMSPADVTIIRKLIDRPHGILLVTGPTGSGKSTTLYSCLHTINSIDQRIITIEEPIEYEIAGVNQIEVKPEIGLTFAMGLRHILRQDPDIIMVGEIRDYETAEIAIRSSMTGHLVFSTLHTNDAAGAITRLIDMKIEPFLIASSVEAVVAQRLVRVLCDACKKPREYEESFLRDIAFPLKADEPRSYFEADECEKCRRTGFMGRTGIFEILLVNDAIRPLIIERASTKTIKVEAIKQGMHTLRQDGWLKVKAGITTFEEVCKVTEEDE